ncbi:MAG: S8 family serine peptidase, partial [Armatimonadetes bacterium]|nr:S8 family serine peptidase [Armatimonadota bacterium]
SLHSRQVDEFIWNHPDMSIVFAAGNDGSDSPTWGASPYETRRMSRLPGDGIIKPGSLFAPGTAKNAITVGASEGFRPPNEGWGGYANSRWSLWGFRAAPISTDYTGDDPEGLAPFSSRGPTADGRIKPDLVAPGTNIISTASSLPNGSTLWGSAGTGYKYNGGTSISAGFVSGAAALVRQWYVEKQGVQPSAALVKATLLNGARELAPGQYGTGATQEIPPRPNGAEGWGRVDVAGALQPLAPLAARFVDDRGGLRTGGERTWLMKVPQGGHSLRVMLAWSDYPGAADAAVALVNDLDLTVTAPDGTTRRGNDREDRRNNVEAVEAPAAEPGIYKVRVRAYNVPQGPQPFALVARGAAGRFLLPGDADLDGVVNVADAVRVLWAVIAMTEMTEEERLAADVAQDGDSAGRVDVSDAVAIMQSIVGLAG